MDSITESQCLRLLKEEPVGHIAVISDGEPYVTAISFVHMNDAIYLRTGPGRRLSALLSGNRCCIEISRYSNDEGDWESVILYGTARVIEDPGLEADAIGLLLVKYRNVFGSALAFTRPTPLAPQEVVVEIPIDEMSGRSAGGGFAVQTRPGRL